MLQEAEVHTHNMTAIIYTTQKLPGNGEQEVKEAHRGSYVKKKQPHNGGEKPKSGSAVGGCRIVNLDQLQKFVCGAGLHPLSFLLERHHLPDR